MSKRPTNIHRQTDRQTNKQTNRQKDRSLRSVLCCVWQDAEKGVYCTVGECMPADIIIQADRQNDGSFSFSAVLCVAGRRERRVPHGG